MQNVLAIILGGGRGASLYPLTKLRAKPAVPIAGSYRLIDFAISNCINSDISQVFTLTQYNSTQLNRHINQAYHPSGMSDSFVEVLAAQQTPDSLDWFRGTADAVRQYLNYLLEFKVEDFLILSGDHVYSMDYRPFVKRHRLSNADLTIAAIDVTKSGAQHYGMLKVDPATKRVLDFADQPYRPRNALLPRSLSERHKSLAEKHANGRLASMGIYLFKRDMLRDILRQHPDYCDFSHDVIPHCVKPYNVHIHVFSKFWERINSVRTYYDTNIKYLEDSSLLYSGYDPNRPLFTRQRFLPPSQVTGGIIRHSKLCDGCIVRKASISKSIIGIRSIVGDNVKIKASIIFGANRYQSREEIERDRRNGIPPIGIGDNSEIKKAIIDKDARIGANVKIINRDNRRSVNAEDKGYIIRDGIVIVEENAIIPDNTII